jgi:hypothetical protein
VAYPNFADWRQRAQSFEEMAAVRGQSFNLTGVDKPTQLLGRMVTWNCWIPAWQAAKIEPLVALRNE